MEHRKIDLTQRSVTRYDTGDRARSWGVDVFRCGRVCIAAASRSLIAQLPPIGRRRRRQLAGRFDVKVRIIELTSRSVISYTSVRTAVVETRHDTCGSCLLCYLARKFSLTATQFSVSRQRATACQHRFDGTLKGP